MLRQLAWSGIPFEHRAQVWQLLLAYLPANLERRAPTLEKRRQEYLEYLKQVPFDCGDLFITFRACSTSVQTKGYQKLRMTSCDRSAIDHSMQFLHSDSCRCSSY